jgi:uroporphyrinogen-III synthase
MTPPAPITILYTGTAPPLRPHPEARILHLPLLDVRPVPFDLTAVADRLDRPSTLVFYSQHSARIVTESGLFDGLDLGRHALWAVGRKTAQWLTDRLGQPVNVPSQERFEVLATDLEQRGVTGDIIAFSLAHKTRDLTGVARAQGVAFIDVPVYETTRRQDLSARSLLLEEDPRWIAFTSPRAVEALVDELEPGDLEGRRIAAIGPSTAEAIEALRLAATIVLDVPDRDGLIEAIVSHERAIDGPQPPC